MSQDRPFCGDDDEAKNLHPRDRTGLAACLECGAQERKRSLLFIGQSKGYQHESISTAMVTLFNLGRSSTEWDTVFRTDCTAITKKPLKYGARNLDSFDALVFFTDGNLDMDDSQKADLLSFVERDGKGFIGIHSATITFVSWPAYGKMIGGYFDGHPWGIFDAPLVVEDAAFPGMSQLPKRLTLKDEIYQIKDFSRGKRPRAHEPRREQARSRKERRPSQRPGFPRYLGPRIWQGSSALQRPRPHPGSLGPTRNPADVARDGALVDGHDSGRRCSGLRPANSATCCPLCARSIRDQSPTTSTTNDPGTYRRRPPFLVAGALAAAASGVAAER